MFYSVNPSKRLAGRGKSGDHLQACYMCSAHLEARFSTPNPYIEALSFLNGDMAINENKIVAHYLAEWRK